MKIMQLCVGMVATNCYIVYDEKSREAAVIDPGDNATSILSAAKKEKLDIKYVLLTHPRGICGCSSGRIWVSSARWPAPMWRISRIFWRTRGHK